MSGDVRYFNWRAYREHRDASYENALEAEDHQSTEVDTHPYDDNGYATEDVFEVMDQAASACNCTPIAGVHYPRCPQFEEIT